MKELKDFPGYSITKDGKVFSYKKKSPIEKDKIDYSKPPKQLKPFSDSCGYARIKLYKNGKGYTLKIHRLVAQTYIENPENLPCINHKNKIRNDNRIENLEWCDPQYNNEYSMAKYFLIETPEGEIITVYNLNKFAREKQFIISGSFSTGKAKSKGYKVIKKIE
jgi:hypothetical protein